MADIRPFSAYRPAPGWAGKIAALPYDVYNREEATRIVEENPYSFLAIDRAETGFGPEVDTYAPVVYERAAKLLDSRIREGCFIREEAPCFYLYEQDLGVRRQAGLVVGASIDDYLQGVIKKHENTRADKEQDRIRHVDVCDMQTGPIFLACRRNLEIRELIAGIRKRDVIMDFVSEDQIRHRVWAVSEEETIRSIQEAFHKVPALYIADGHHRCASAVKVGLLRRQQHPGYTGQEPFNRILAVVFPEDELSILDYNRLVRDLNGYTVAEFLQRVARSFQVEDVGQIPYRPQEKGSFGMYLEGTWYRLTARETIRHKDLVEDLDVSLLQNHLLGPVLGIQDPRTDKRIDFVGGIRGLEELVRRVDTDMKVAFSLYPTSIRELLDVADAGRLMPPKSTWFEPKLRSGLFLHRLGG